MYYTCICVAILLEMKPFVFSWCVLDDFFVCFFSSSMQCVSGGFSHGWRRSWNDTTREWEGCWSPYPMDGENVSIRWRHRNWLAFFFFFLVALCIPANPMSWLVEWGLPCRPERTPPGGVIFLSSWVSPKARPYTLERTGLLTDLAEVYPTNQISLSLASYLLTKLSWKKMRRPGRSLRPLRYCGEPDGPATASCVGRWSAALLYMLAVLPRPCVDCCGDVLSYWSFSGSAERRCVSADLPFPFSITPRNDCSSS